MLNSKIFIPMLAAFLLQGCTANDTATDRKPVAVKTIKVSNSATVTSQTYSGTIEEESGTGLSFAVAGTVKTVNVIEGQTVTKGQVIATLDDSSLSSMYSAAAATLDQAKDAYGRMKQLHDAGSLPEIKWIEVKTTLSQAESAEKVARKSLDDATLRAPFGGVISSKSVEVGQNVMPGLSVANIVTTLQLDARISVPETEIASVALGQYAAIKVQALSGREYAGTVTEKGVVAKVASRSYDVKIRIKDPDPTLLPGMVAEVKFLTPNTSSLTSIVLPENIIQLGDDNSNFVWTVKDGKADRRTITVGDYTAEGVIVTSGLNDGDVVIVEGEQKVSVGTNVEVL